MTTPPPFLGAPALRTKSNTPARKLAFFSTNATSAATSTRSCEIGALSDELISNCMSSAVVVGPSNTAQHPAKLALVCNFWNAIVTPELWRHSDAMQSLHAWATDEEEATIPKHRWPAVYDLLKRTTPTPQAHFKQESSWLVPCIEQRLCGFTVTRSGAPQLRFDLVSSAAESAEIHGQVTHKYTLFAREGSEWGRNNPLFHFSSDLSGASAHWAYNRGEFANPTSDETLLQLEEEAIFHDLIPALALGGCTWSHREVCKLLTAIAVACAAGNPTKVGEIDMLDVMEDICGCWSGSDEWPVHPDEDVDPSRGTSAFVLDEFPANIEAALVAELLCTCQTPFKEGVTMVACVGGCGGRFHPRCVGLSLAKAEQLDQFFCPACAAGADRE